MGRFSSSRGQGGRGRGTRGGRGRGFAKSSSGRSYSGSGPVKEAEYKFYPHTAGNNRPVKTYETVKDHIIQLIQKTFKDGQDVVESLRDMKMIDLSAVKPARMISQETDKARN